MNTMGIRAKPGEVTFAIFNTESQALSNVETIRVPKALPTPDALKYVRNNILDVIREYNISRAGLRITESTAQSMSVPRIEMEGVIQEAFASSTLSSYYCGRIATIAARVGISRADFKPYVKGERSFEQVENWSELNPEEREAVFAALGAANV
ncbi:hypothetical protein [Thermomonas fusca]|uniref:hypothetical protein n=1 Tax=Thermomonas fusca TaxID=215690 RepID=UPI000A045DCD|nr:hypothetical protein [Thermomonas fusca]